MLSACKNSLNTVTLVNFKKRPSVRASHVMNNQVDAINEGYLVLVEKGKKNEIKYYFKLDARKRKFEYYYDKDAYKNEKIVDSIDINYITKVSRIQKDEEKFKFEVCTVFKNFELICESKDERDKWVYSLTKAATLHTTTQNSTVKKSTSFENLSTTQPIAIPHRTTVHGGMVFRKPIAKENILEGWCWKQGGVVKNWKRRYFRLSNGELSYYDTEHVKDPIRTIMMKHVKSVNILQKYCQRPILLELKTDKRNFFIQPEDEKDLTKWKNAIEKCLSQSSRFYHRSGSL
ncbi:pleckstrin homology domain-containing family A member 1 isoform X1 [Hydra vulgaris]|uniref:pleckstrin homology domain-containing family A member 1 isoform X1 n=1 Tax=Hydra vulgaris TaxID=6087 RepID=UPI001F5F44FA|nr:pleckstrin homology domain-containing family A member 1-like isoform X1 [Hydra vulgaris]